MREYLLIFLIAAVVSYLLCVFARELASRLGAVARVRDRDVHSIPIPYFGGVAMLGGLGAGVLLGHHLPFLSNAQETVFHDAGTVLIAGAMICLVGVIDDLIELDALTKLGGQIVAAAFMVLNGVQFSSLSLPWVGQFVLDPTQAVLLTMLMVVGTVNAVNFVDGLDGLAGGIVAIAAIAFFAYSFLLSVEFGFQRAILATLICALLAGICLGFLPHNMYPARIFMGDTGSMLIGLLLAAAMITLTGRLDPSALRGATLFPALLPLLLPLAVIAIPLIDVSLAVVRRTKAGVSPFAADKQHLHHRLLQMGHSQRRAVSLMHGWTALLAFAAVSLAFVSVAVSVVVFLLGAAAMTLFVIRPNQQAHPTL